MMSASGQANFGSIAKADELAGAPIFFARHTWYPSPKPAS
jgi:hypothetical protein